MSKRIAFVVNPSAGNGAAGSAWSRMEAEAKDRLGPFQTHATSKPHDATRLARKAVLSGAQIVVSVGGDGTLNEVVNGLMDDGGPLDPGVALGYLPWGTGCDLIRSVPVSRDLHGAIDNILSNRRRIIDIGRLTCRDHHGREVKRYFHNVLSFGLGGEVDERVNQTSKVFGGFVSFIWATLVSLLRYDKKQVLLCLDDHHKVEVTAWNVAVANGRYHGGGMQIAPAAAPDDGLFHVTVIGDLHLAEVFRHLTKLYTGRIYDVEKVEALTCRKLVATSVQPVLIDMDGEQPGRLPVTAEIIPSALAIVSN